MEHHDDHHDATISKEGRTSTLPGEVHDHFASFSFHPGYTTLISCVMLVVLLFVYLWSGSIQRLYLRIRSQMLCCNSSNSDSNQLKEEIEMFQKEDSAGSAVSSENNGFSDAGSDEEHSSERDNFSGENDSKKSNRSLYNAPISTNSTNTLTKFSPVKNFFQTPLILFTPATPLPTHSTTVDVKSSRFSIESGSDANREGSPIKFVL